jgi:Ser/Thr protein kinase RdoA (MazF antagonist)
MSTYKNLDLEHILTVAEACGFHPTGQYFQLNSYENRVFDLFLEGDQLKRLICKVYRPGRWSLEAIKEEHAFLDELQASGIPAVAPLHIHGETCFVRDGLIYSFFPRASGRMCEELNSEDLKSIGRQLARLHNIGAQNQAQHRPQFDVETMGWQALDDLVDWVAPEVWTRYEEAATTILSELEELTEGLPLIRIHGDCHKGNILQSDPLGGNRQFFFVDFDDFINGLPVQDFWMLFSSDESDNHQEVEDFLEGYESLRVFDTNQLKLMPLLRGLRIITYARWISQRWEIDPSFPQLFPSFLSYSYWVEDTEALEKIAWRRQSSH